MNHGSRNCFYNRQMGVWDSLCLVPVLGTLITQHSTPREMGLALFLIDFHRHISKSSSLKWHLTLMYVAWNKGWFGKILLFKDVSHSLIFIFCLSSKLLMFLTYEHIKLCCLLTSFIYDVWFATYIFLKNYFLLLIFLFLYSCYM